MAAHPTINIDLQEKPNGDIARGVREGRADLGIVAGDVDLTGLRAVTSRPTGWCWWWRAATRWRATSR